MTRCEEASAPYCCNNWACDDVLCRYGVALNEEYMGMMFLDTRILGKDYILHGCGGLDPAAELDIHDDVLRKNSRTIRREYISSIWHSQPSLVSRFDGDSCFCIGLLTSEKGLMLTGTLYKIPRDCVNEIVGWQHDTVCNSREGDTFRETAPSIDYKLCFMTRGGVEIVDRAFSLRNLEMMNIVCVMLENMEEKRGRNGCEYTGGTQLWMITPLVGGFAKSFVKWISVDLPKDYVAKIASATISVKE